MPRRGADEDFDDEDDFDRDPGEEMSGRAVWIRGGLTLLFLIGFELAQLLLNLLAFVQFLVLLVARKPNGFIVSFGRSLAIWQAHVTAFASGATEDRPFPFAPWPDPGG